MEESLLQAITEIIEDKKSRRIAPNYALDIEVYKAVNNALNQLYRQEKIEVGETLNHKWIKIK